MLIYHKTQTHTNQPSIQYYSIVYTQIRGAYDKFPNFFVWAFKIAVDS